MIFTAMSSLSTSEVNALVLEYMSVGTEFLEKQKEATAKRERMTQIEEILAMDRDQILAYAQRTLK